MEDTGKPAIFKLSIMERIAVFSSIRCVKDLAMKYK